MRVIPVLDLMGGQVVRGVGGRRAEYRPIESRLARDARPVTVARAFAECGFQSVYVADLDAIAGTEPAWSCYEDLLECGLEPWVDAGLAGAGAAAALSRFAARGRQLAGIVAGLESLRGPAELAAIARVVEPQRLIFSLDLQAGRPLTTAPAWRGMTPPAIAQLALRLGIRRMIVLDLAAVGTGAGVPTLPLCRALANLDSDLEIIAGGGVRGASDLRALAAAGCHGALVASALHDGRLAPPAGSRG
ncbi:MAG: HisA/HisF-related TIM barrel protein [Pirellulales bacterium]